MDPERAAYERFDASINQGIVDPTPIIDELRALGPVIRSTGSTFGSWTLPHVFSIPDDMPSAMVLSYDAVTDCLRDAERFRHQMYPDVGGETFLHMDGPPHRRYRLLLNEIFSAPACAAWRRELIEPVVDRLVDGFADDGVADLRRQFCEILPPHVFGAILGVPESDFEQLKAWAVYLIAAPMDPEAAAQMPLLGEYLGKLVAERRTLPADELAARGDLVSAMIRAEHSEFGSLSDEEIVSALFILVAAGNETTSRGLGSLLFQLLTRPTLLEEVRNDRDLALSALEETLRLAPAGGCFELRLAVDDAELDGEPVAAGTGVVTNLYTANRDPSRWERPDEFDLHRPRSQTMTFGFGPHMCLGMHLARQEILAALDALLDRLPNLRLDDAVPPPRIYGLWFPGVDHLQVRWGLT